MYIPFSIFPVKIVCWSSFLVVQVFRSKIVLWPAAARRETERRDTRKVGTYRAWIRMFLSFIGPPFDDITVLPSPSFMFMACGRLERERKTCLRLNMWCEAPEPITVREVYRGDDRRAKDSSIWEDSRVCASVSQCHACRWGLALGQSQRQEGGQSLSKPPAGGVECRLRGCLGFLAEWRYPQQEPHVIPRQGGSR